jgi:polysaccharide chain length determinant protein (PEP-CTERM system associated)
MARNGEISLADAKRVLRKRWWIPALCIPLMAVLGLAATYVLPKKYTSSTSVLVEQPEVDPGYVRPVVTADLNQRLASMKAQLLSSSRLEPIIEKFNLYPDQRNKVPMEVLVGNLSKAVKVELLEPMQGATDRRPPGFEIAVTMDNPDLAQKVCEEISSLFREQNAQRRIESATDTTQFLSDHLDEAKAKMDEQDARLAQFKRQYLGALPQEEGSNLQLLAGLNTQLEAATQSLNRAQQDKAFNETMVTQQEANWKLLQSGQENPDNLDRQLSNLQDQLTGLLARYTPEYPDVVKVQAQIQDLKQRMAQEADPNAPTTTPLRGKAHEPAQLQQLRARIKQDEVTTADLTKRQTQIQDQIRQIQGRIQSTPMVEEQFKELTRNSQAATDFYNDLLRKRSNSAMATDLEHQQQSETFRVLDRPNRPSSPSFPKLPMFIGGGACLGLFVAVTILYMIALLDMAMYTERDAEACLRLPVLVSVPDLDVVGAHRNNSSEHRKPNNYEAALALKA